MIFALRERAITSVVFVCFANAKVLFFSDIIAAVSDFFAKNRNNSYICSSDK